MMAALAVGRPVFHSEADFQHAFAWELQRAHPGARIRLETRPVRGEHLDVLFTDSDRRVAIELKYLTAGWAGRVVGESFELLSQGAQDIRAYDCVKDIVRVERYTAATPGSSGLVVVLANDAAYWRPVTHGRLTKCGRLPHSRGRGVARGSWLGAEHRVRHDARAGSPSEPCRHLRVSLARLLALGRTQRPVPLPGLPSATPGRVSLGGKPNSVSGERWGPVSVEGALARFWRVRELHTKERQSMADTRNGEQSIRRAARQAAVAAQARRRAKAAERDKRLDAAALTLIVTLKQRDALERRAGAAIRAMLTAGLTLADVLTWTDGETTLKEATRLSDLETTDRALS